MSTFQLKSKFQPKGDQPQAIEKLVGGLKKGLTHQTLLGVTGSGKTFTMANVIAQIGKPTLVIAHNKTLAAQLAQEYQDFFPDNAVHYFVSYYDYYQPEAYIAATDTYIEKDAQINEEIERLRHASTQALLTRKDVIIVASVSCIYGLGSPAEYLKEHLKLAVGDKLSRTELLTALVDIFYERTNADLELASFRAIGNSVEIMPPGEKQIFDIKLEGDKIAEIIEIDPLTRQIVKKHDSIFLFPAKHFITNEDDRKRAIKAIRLELEERLKFFEDRGLLLEAERIKRRTTYDLAMMEEIGYCSGIENYSRHLSGRPAGEAPDTLLSYFPKTVDGKPDFLTVIDESHVTIPQIGGMFAGDESRKKNLVEYGFRLPSALDNRPLKFYEFEEKIGPAIYTSATPGEYERLNSEQVVEQIIRPTGLVDPILEVRPVVQNGDFPGQIKDFIAEAAKDIKNGGRVIATTLTKKMAEDLSLYLKEQGIKAEYLHSEIKTLERIKILTEFRRGTFDCLVGVNLLREGLDLPELSFIGILDADKEGFLRSEVSLIQTIGRAARNVNGRVILYADHITNSMAKAIGETNRRREIQIAYNTKHGITPQTIIKEIRDITKSLESDRDRAIHEILTIELKDIPLNATASGKAKLVKKLIKEKAKQMSSAVKELDFETAAMLRDEIKELENSAKSGGKNST
ncbi:MAG: excinuclease ABC subunit UvrB [Candidatus Vogelbacteria bacterium]|nr:excinuclease ABC subunit UvrB [Candidatus Vogelbacteria bacterium]